MNIVSIIIPVREGGNPEITLKSLATQTFKDFEILVSYDHRQGANAARNKGFGLSQSKFILFSDDDIQWRPNALEILYQTLRYNHQASYSYGAYLMDGKIYCNRTFSPDTLKQNNYISTMSLIRSDCFPGFDESIYRLQDWDLFLTLLRKRHIGVYCNSVIFSTDKRIGITHDNPFTWQEARDIVARKHGLDTELVVSKNL